MAEGAAVSVSAEKPGEKYTALRIVLASETVISSRKYFLRSIRKSVIHLHVVLELPGRIKLKAELKSTNMILGQFRFGSVECRAWLTAASPELQGMGGD